ncbi:unnamed protein product [Clonostachys rosea]|uniref:alcohol dehydrogenase n=1 Tax=Bionectria ochroleuca TaxID=29856 RepID=A0ABY6UR84_BIOOC|nr:unnamed protein product [Clonostachys rosea]
MSAYEIPKTQWAAVKTTRTSIERVVMKLIDVPRPKASQILLKITYTGLCGSDKSFLCDDWEAFGINMSPETEGIAGHEGVGVVVAVGEDMKGRWNIGDRAGVKWIASVCGKCDFCQDGEEVHCLNQTNSGFTAPGTFQRYCVADGQCTTKIPDTITDQEAAPILCGGVTAYAACKKSGVRPGGWIVIPGAGGGLGHLAVQYAHAMGMRVIAVDTGERKRQLCLDLGADAFIDFATTEDTVGEVKKLTKHGAHGVLVIASSKEAFTTAPKFLRPKGTVVVIGLPVDTSVVMGVPPGQMTQMELRVVGSFAAIKKEVEEAFDLSIRGLPIVSEGELEELDSWIDKLQGGQVAGRVVLRVAN